MKEQLRETSRKVVNFLSAFTWTNFVYVLIFIVSLSDCERSTFNSQMSYQRRSKHINDFSEARFAALQESPPSTNPCEKGYVLDRLNNKCVKRFVSIYTLVMLLIILLRTTVFLAGLIVNAYF